MPDCLASPNVVDVFGPPKETPEPKAIGVRILSSGFLKIDHLALICYRVGHCQGTVCASSPAVIVSLNRFSNDRTALGQRMQCINQSGRVRHHEHLTTSAATCTRVLSASELQALAAHEIAHEFLWATFDEIPSGVPGKGSS